jgi:hypothetical protein
MSIRIKVQLRILMIFEVPTQTGSEVKNGRTGLLRKFFELLNDSIGERKLSQVHG